jgi:LruC domain-containing protein
MKKKFIFLAAVLLLTACSSDDNVTSEKGKQTTQTETVEPSSQSWSNDLSSSINVTSPVTTTISIYADETCSTPIVLNKLIKANTATSIGFTIADNIETVYVAYPTSNGKKTMAVTLTTTTSQKSAGTGHAPAPCILPEDCVVSSTTMSDYTSYHSTGTIMMDADWPSASPASGTVIARNPKMYKLVTGYNDLVVDYDIQSNVLDPSASYNFDANTWKEGLKLVFHIRALGSKLPDKFGLKLENLKQEYVNAKEVKVTLGNYDDAPEGSITAQVTEDDGHPVILIENLQWLLSPACTFNNSNATYYNVDRSSRDEWLTTGEDYINHGSPLFTVTVNLSGKVRTLENYTSLEEQSNEYIASVIQTDQENFFMQTTEGYEIHLRGFAPLSTYQESYKQILAANYASNGGKFMDTRAEYYYCTNFGYPWAIKLPVLTKHIYKDGTMDNAYPSFNKWCVTSGAQNQDWYEPTKVDDTYIVKWW